MLRLPMHSSLHKITASRKSPKKMSVEHDVFPPPLDISEAVTWDVDHDYIEHLGVDVDAFIVRLWVREGCPFFARATAVHLAGAWTPGRDPSTMKGKVQLATEPALLYVDQVQSAWVVDTVFLSCLRCVPRVGAGVCELPASGGCVLCAIFPPLFFLQGKRKMTGCRPAKSDTPLCPLPIDCCWNALTHRSTRCRSWRLCGRLPASLTSPTTRTTCC